MENFSELARFFLAISIPVFFVIMCYFFFVYQKDRRRGKNQKRNIPEGARGKILGRIAFWGGLGLVAFSSFNAQWGHIFEKGFCLGLFLLGLLIFASSVLFGSLKGDRKEDEISDVKGF